jgi:hypothetical protein
VQASILYIFGPPNYQVWQVTERALIRILLLVAEKLGSNLLHPLPLCKELQGRCYLILNYPIVLDSSITHAARTSKE